MRPARRFMAWIIACFVALLAPPALGVSADRPAVSLDGRWAFRFAPDDRGVAERWFEAAVPFDRTLEVPGCWDAQGVGEPTDKMRHNAVGVGWYRRTFTVPDDWRGRRVWLVVGGAHRTARVYVNGQRVAEHVGYPVEFRVDLTDGLRAGAEQSLVVAVDSRPDVLRDPLVGTFDVIDFMDLNWGGIFEHVRLEATGETWIEDAFARPDPAKRRADVDIALGGIGGDAEASYVVRTAADGRTLATGVIPIRDGRGTASIDLPDAPLWSPADPRLLTVELKLARGGKALDQRLVRFGLRRIEARDGQFLLNGNAVFLRGYGDDFNFPRELLPPADVPFWKAYLQKRKDFGFNYVRHHSMMPTESYLAAADEVGMLVQPELPIAYMEYLAKAKGKALDVYGRVWQAYIRQMRNHPSVMSWCMGNEQIGGMALGKELYRQAKELDPTRPVIESDGMGIGEDRPTLDYRPVQFDEHVIPWGATRNKYANPYVAKPTVVHEMGNLSCLPDPADADAMDGAILPFWLEQMRDAVKRQHLEDVLPAMLRASWRYQASLIKLNAEAARLGPGISGYEQWLFRDYWTQSTGIESIVGTTRALSTEQARRFNADAVLLWDHDRVNFRAGEAIPVKVVLSDFRPSSAPKIDRVTVRLGDTAVTLNPPTGAESRGNVGPWTGRLTAPNVRTPQRLTLSADAGDVRNEWSVWIWPAAPEPAKDGLVIARRLTADVLRKLDAGARVLLTDDTITFPTQNATFKPAWWKGDEHGNFVHGNLFLDHPALAGFPHDGYGDLQCYGLLNDRPVVDLDQLPGDIRPIVWALDVPWKLRRMAYLWEVRVGRGKLLVSAFDLSPQRRRDDPAAAWMYALLTRYAAGPSFQPTATLLADWLRRRVDSLRLPDLATCVEGFDAVTAASSAEHTTWFTDREPSAALYVVRQTDGTHRLTWTTAPLPPDWPHDTATFVWSGGIGFRSQPDAGPFQLSLDGHPLCTIPFTPTSAEWPCAGGGTLRYAVLRRTTEDTAGLFFLTLPKSQFTPGRPVSLTLSTAGKGSRRWMTVVPYRDALRSLRGD